MSESNKTLNYTRSTPHQRLLSSRDAVSYLTTALLQKPNSKDWNAAAITAYKVSLCNDKSNMWNGSDVVNKKTGECFEATGKLWRCNKRLCFDCLASFQRRNRKKLRTIIETSKVPSGYDHRLITLTIVNDSNHSMKFQRSLLEKTWSLLRKRVYFKKNFRGAVKSEEFTFGRSGYHWHIHLLGETKYIMRAMLRTEWTTCYLEACRQLGVNESISTADGLLVVDVRRVYNLQTSLFEVTKYLTKGETWNQIPKEDLIEFAAISRHPRMIEFIGQWRNKALTLSNAETENAEVYDEPLADITLVHKEYLSDGSSITTAAEFMQTLSDIRSKCVEVQQFRINQIRYHQKQAKLFRKMSDMYDRDVESRLYELAKIRFRPNYTAEMLKGFQNITVLDA